MRAAVFERVGAPLRICDLPDPSPGPGEVIVRTRRCGICGSDLHWTEGGGLTVAPRTVLGHELCGEIVAVGRDVRRHTIGDRVAVMPLWSCGACPACRAGTPNRCAQFEMMGFGRIPGGYAEYTSAKDPLCFTLPDSLGWDEGALVEPLAVALRGVRMAGIGDSSRVLVLGAGPIGLAAVFWARELGAHKIAVAAPSQHRAHLAAEMGADGFLQLSEHIADEASALLGGAPEVVIECVGRPGCIDKALRIAAVGGSVVVLGYCLEPDSFTPTHAANKELTIRFSIIYEIADYAQVIEKLSAGASRVLRMVTARIGLDQLPGTFESLRRRTHQCKVLVDPSISLL